MFRKITALLGGLAVAFVGAFALAGTAQADHATPSGGAFCGADHEGTTHEGYVCEERSDDDQPRWYPTETPEGFKLTINDECELTIAADGLTYNVSSGMKTAGLAVRVDGTTIAYTAPEAHDDGAGFTSDDSLTVGPFTENTTVEYRWFAGPDRNDLPAWDATGPADEGWDDVVAEIVTREDDEDRFWDARDDADFVNWYSTNVKGCPGPSPTPSESPSAAPGDDGEGGGKLPETSGVSVLPVLLGGGVLLLTIGAAMAVTARRRRITL